MADTIRIRKALSRTPEVSTLAQASGLSSHEVVGLLVDFWGWADDKGRGKGRISFAEKAGCLSIYEWLCEEIGGNAAFWNTLPLVGWLLIGNGFLTIPKPQKYKEKIEEAETSIEGALEREELQERFRLFWLAYPRKTAKAAAEKAWGKVRPSGSLLSMILDAIERQKKSKQWSEGVIPHPATWLNGRRWEDEGSRIDGPPRCGRELREEGKYDRFEQ